jgi:hypothetical protein
MAQLIIEIPDAIAPRVLKTLCSRFGYVGTVKDLDGVTDIPNPEARAHFVRRKVAVNVKYNNQNATGVITTTEASVELLN